METAIKDVSFAFKKVPVSIGPIKNCIYLVIGKGWLVSIKRFNTIFQAISLITWFCFDKVADDVYY